MLRYAIKPFAPPYCHKGIVIYQKKFSGDFWRVSVRFSNLFSPLFFRLRFRTVIQAHRRRGEAESTPVHWWGNKSGGIWGAKKGQ